MKINYPAVLVAAILHWILGAVWYGVFSSKFIELMAWTPAQLAAMETQSETKNYIRSCLLWCCPTSWPTSSNTRKPVILRADCRRGFGFGWASS
jgi:hypothetical protein